MSIESFRRILICYTRNNVTIMKQIDYQSVCENIVNELDTIKHTYGKYIFARSVKS